MLERFRGILRPPDLGDVDANRASRTQHWILLATVSVATVLLVTAPILGAPVQSILVYLGVASVSWIAFGLLHANRPRWAGFVFSAGLWVVGAATVALYGVNSGALIVHMTAIIFAGFFWSPRGTILVVVASAAWLGLIAYAGSRGLLSEPPRAQPFRIWVSASAAYAVVAAVMQLAVKGLNDALAEARESAEEARQSKTALEVSVAEQRRSEDAEAQLRRELEEARRLEAIGRLAGGVAHDFNNLLTVLTTHTALLRRRGSSGDEHLVEMDRACRRASALTRQLLAVGGRQLREARVLRLTDVVAGLEELLRRLLPENVELTLDLGNEVPPVFADETQLEQVLVNLVANARDAMPNGGSISVDVSALEVTAAPVAPTAPSGVKPGSYATLQISDTGQGMDEATRGSIFEPFFTTKTGGSGTGLGLATVHGIVTQSSGYVWVESEPRRGSKFVVILPATDAVEEPLATVPAARSEERRPQSGVVLLVEDEPMVRGVLNRVLTAEGFDVRMVANGEEALEVHEEMSTIDLLVTDIVMPGLPGTELARRLREARGELPVLLLSGYASENLPEVPNMPGVAFLHKPFVVESLLDVLERLLTDARSGSEVESRVASTR